MASKGRTFASVLRKLGQFTLEERTWAGVAGTQPQQNEATLLIQGELLEKLQNSIHDFVQVDEYVRKRVAETNENALYGKFLGKAPLLEIVRTVLTEKWKQWGSFTLPTCRTVISM